MINKLKSFFSKPSYQAVALFVFFFIYYVSLSPKGLVSYGWSTDLTRIGFINGNFSSIQFGLLLKIINVFTNLLPFSVIKNSYLLASFLGALVLGLLYSLISKIENTLQIGDKKTRFLIKNLIIVLLGTSQIFVLSSLFIERYMLVVLGLETVVLLLYKMHQDKYNLSKSLILLAATLMLGISYHWLFLWALMFVVILNKERVSKKNMLSVVSGVLLVIMGGFILGHLLSSSTPSTYAYFGSKSIKDSVTMYSNTYLNDGLGQKFDINLNETLNVFQDLIKNLTNTTGILMMFFGLIGIRILGDKYGKKIIFGILFLSGLFLWPSLLLSNIGLATEAMELYALVTIIPLSILSWIGVAFVVGRLSKGLSVVHGRNLGYLIVSLSVGFLMMLSLFGGVKYSNYSDYEDRSMREILNEIPDNSVVLCFEDLLCGDLIYLSTIEKVGSEIEILPYYFHPDTYSLDLSKYRPFEYSNPPFISHEVISVALSSDARVFSVGVRGDYYRFLGFNLGFVHYLPRGNFGELLLTTPKVWPNIDNLDAMIGDVSNNTPLESKFINLLISNRVLNSHTYFSSGRYAQGYNEMNTSSVIASKLSSDDFFNFLSQRNNAEQQKRNALFIESDQTDSVERIYKEIPIYVEGGYHGRVADLVRGTIILNPLDPEVRKKASIIYESIGLEELADFEMNIYKKLQVK